MDRRRKVTMTVSDAARVSVSVVSECWLQPQKRKVTALQKANMYFGFINVVVY